MTMILFSPAKINLGLHITGRRTDGFHDLQSVMFPIGLCDILDIRPLKNGSPGVKFSHSGIDVNEGPGENLCEKAYEMMAGETHLPPVEIHLHKQIPVGAGLGGGSSNATSTLEGLNLLAKQPLTRQELHTLASRLGSDCPYFLYQNPMMMEGRGEILSPVAVDLGGLYLVVLFPGVHISTAEAYAGITPLTREVHLNQMVVNPLGQWDGLVINDFESGIFQKYPALASIKKGLYEAGAVYASLSGSGSSLFGLFRDRPEFQVSLARYVVWEGPTDQRE